MNPRYVHTPDMGEISGFGGEYEALCQDMLHASVSWLLANPDKTPIWQTYRGVYGLVSPHNEAAKELEAAILAADTEQVSTGAMLQAVVERCLYIKKHGWEAYCEMCRKVQRERAWARMFEL